MTGVGQDGKVGGTGVSTLAPVSAGGDRAGCSGQPEATDGRAREWPHDAASSSR